MEDWKQELEEILKEETDMGRDMIPKYARCYARIILENFISQELDRAMEEGYEECKKDMAVGVGLATDTELPEIVSKIASKLTTK